MSIYISILKNLSDQNIKNQLWNSAISNLYDLKSDNSELQQIMAVTSLLNQVQLQKPQLDYKIKQLDSLMEELSSELFSKEQNSNDQIQIDEIQHSLLQNIITQALILHIGMIFTIN